MADLLASTSSMVWGLDTQSSSPLSSMVSAPLPRPSQTRIVAECSSFVSVDENVVVGSVAAAADKDSIASYGSLEAVGEKLAKKRSVNTPPP